MVKIEHAAMIVQAVNSHEELVNALNEVLANTGWNNIGENALSKAKQALAKAGAK